MQVDVVDSFDKLEPLREDWERVYGADPEAHFFLSWTWMSNWLRQANFSWLVLAVRATDGPGRYEAFLPLQIRVELDERTGFHNSIRMGGSYFAVYTGLLCAPDAEAAALPALAQSIKSLNWRTFHLDDLFMSDRRRAAFAKHFEPGVFSAEKIDRRRHVTAAGDDIDHDTYVYVDLPGDWEEFLDTRLGPKIRRDVRYFLRKTDAGDEFRITLADTATAARDLNAFMRFWLEQWYSKSEGYARGIVDNCRKMLPPCLADGCLFAPVLWQGDKQIGVHIAFIDKAKRRLICFLVGRDRSVRKPPPGFVLHAFTLRWAIANGFTVYDLGTGDFSYKYSFGSTEHRIEGIRISTRSGSNLGERLDPRTTQAALGWAKRLRTERRFELAEKGCRQILELAPEHLEATELLAALHDDMAGDPDIQFARAQDLHRTGNALEASRLYVSILDKHRHHFGANFMLGIACLQFREFDAAEQYLRRALATDPTHAVAQNNHGNALRALKRHDEALAAYERATALRPGFVEAHNNMGVVMRELGRRAEALACFDRALAIDATFAKAVANRAALATAPHSAPE